jgi:nicotinamide mononucleotide transporter
LSSPLEIAANVFNTLAILLAGRNSVHTWWTSIAGCTLFGILFFTSKLYADVTLQLFFIGTSIWGWRRWLHGADSAEALPVTHVSRSTLTLATLAGAIAAAAYGALLYYFSDAYAPFVDSIVLAFSVVAQVLLMQRRVENWPVWVLVNTVAVPLYWSRDLHLTAVLYGVYWLNALVAWRHWHTLAKGPAR